MEYSKRWFIFVTHSLTDKTNNMEYQVGDKVKVLSTSQEVTIDCIGLPDGGPIRYYLVDECCEWIRNEDGSLVFLIGDIEPTEEQKEAYYHAQQMEQHHEVPHHWGI